MMVLLKWGSYFRSGSFNSMKMPSIRTAFLLFFLFPRTILAGEGMWLPALLQELEKEGKLREVGMRLDAEDIHSLKESSLTDAIVHFGGGCTASLISDRGLILTNHHCGYSQIQDHSSVDDDLLKNGFWSHSLDEELKNPGLEATLIKGIIDVSDEMLKGVSDTLTEQEREGVLEKNTERILADSVKGEHLEGKVRSFGNGNAFFLFLTKTYKDVRLVAAPPSSIGKFGGDEDNWMWPRHTGDFSVFRIYAGPDDRPAGPSEENVPYRPEEVLPISLKGVSPGDPAMIVGFPGSTRQYLPSGYIRFLKDRNFPSRVRMRDAGLKVIENAMRKSDSLRIQYAGKQSSISNYHKKWQGAIEGLERIDAIERRKKDEERFLDSAKANGDEEAIQVMKALDDAYKRYQKPELARDLFIEFMYYGPDMIRYMSGFNELFSAYGKAKEEGELDSLIKELEARGERFFKKHSLEVNEKLFKAEAPIYRERMPAGMLPNIFDRIDSVFDGDLKAYGKHLYDHSIFLNPERFDAFLSRFKEKGPSAAQEDPAFRFVNSLYKEYGKKVRPRYRADKARVDSLMRLHVADRRELMPGPHWYDANNTLRVSFGRIEGSSPKDGLRYQYATTLKGVMEKADSTKKHFGVPDRLKELYRKGEYGRYGVNGHMPVCFTSSLHTSGGNSGSPVVNANGHLIGLNFDRSWESVMSDLMYDAERCRNISTDIRYVLFVIDKLGQCDRLIEEMVIADTEHRSKEVRARIEDDPEDRRARAQEVQLLIETGKKDKARKRLENAWDSVPSSPEFRVAYARTMDRKEGIEHLEKLVMEYPDHYGAWCSLGELRAGEGQDQAAVKAYTKAIGKHPSRTKAYSARAVLYKKMGKAEEACSDIGALERLDPLAVPLNMEQECSVQ